MQIKKNAQIFWEKTLLFGYGILLPEGIFNFGLDVGKHLDVISADKYYCQGKLKPKLFLSRRPDYYRGIFHHCNKICMLGQNIKGPGIVFTT